MAQTTPRGVYYCRVDGLSFPDVRGIMAHLRLSHNVREYDRVLVGQRTWE